MTRSLQPLPGNRFYVVFQPVRKDTGWWRYFIDDKFGHCFLIQEESNGNLIVLDDILEITAYPKTQKQALLKSIEGGRILVVEAPLGRKSPWGLFLCVQSVMAVLGINDLILTPKQLFTKLKTKYNIKEL